MYTILYSFECVYWGQLGAVVRTHISIYPLQSVRSVVVQLFHARQIVFYPIIQAQLTDQKEVNAYYTFTCNTIFEYFFLKCNCCVIEKQLTKNEDLQYLCSQ